MESKKRKTSNIFFHYLQKGLRVQQARCLKTFISNHLNQKGYAIRRIDFVFCSDTYLLKLNQSSLGHDFYTDILTFPLNCSENIVEAEIYISIERVKINSDMFIVSANNELLRVIFHGILHLIGFNDVTEEDKSKMTREEDNLLYLFETFDKKVSRETTGK